MDDHTLREATRLQCVASCALIEMAAMNAENAARVEAGASPAYSEWDFYNLIDKHGIDHNSVIAAFFP